MIPQNREHNAVLLTYFIGSVIIINAKNIDYKIKLKIMLKFNELELKQIL